MADSLHQNFPHLFPDDMALENSVFDEPIGGQPAFSVENFEVGGEDFHQEFSQHPMDTSAGFFSDSFGDADLYTRDAMNEQNWSLDASQFGLHDDVSSRVAEPLSGLLEPEHRQEHVTQEPQREMMHESDFNFAIAGPSDEPNSALLGSQTMVLDTLSNRGPKGSALIN